MATGRPPDKKDLYCSFCNKSQHEVKKLIAGPGVYICNECIALCNDILTDSDKSANTPRGAKTDLIPEEIFNRLGEYVVGQDVARRRIAVAVYKHYVRINNLGKTNGVDLEKSNILLIGPTGSGKTFLAQTLAGILNVPFVIADATKITEAGYVGEDVETMLQLLIARAEYDPTKAAHGIVYLDEFDKLARRSDGNFRSTRDVGGEGVQQGLLKIIEGTIANVPPPGGKKSGNQEYVQLDTRNILFIVGGAFEGLREIVLRRGQGTAIGFTTERKAQNPSHPLHGIESEDLVAYGIIPELVGRLPIVTTLDDLSRDDLVRILSEPKNALLKQFGWLFAQQGTTLRVTDRAKLAIADLAIKKKTGGRALRAILEEALFEVEYRLPTLAKEGKKIDHVFLDAGAEGTLAPAVIVPTHAPL